MENGFTVSAAVVNYNNFATLPACIESVLANTKKYPLNLTVIDNGSADGSLNYLKQQKDVQLITAGKNLGFGNAHNAVLPLLNSKYHAVINPDIEFSYDVISELCDILEAHPELDMVTPKILNPAGDEQYLPKKEPTFRYMFLGRLARLGGPFKKIREEYTRQNEALPDICPVEFCTGCFFVIRSDVFKAVNGFDSRYFMYMEDADLTKKVIKNGGKAAFCKNFYVTHKWERGSAKNIKLLCTHISSFIKFKKKWSKER